jgi:hypothetical protein
MSESADERGFPVPYLKLWRDWFVLTQKALGITVDQLLRQAPGPK